MQVDPLNKILEQDHTFQIEDLGFGKRRITVSSSGKPPLKIKINDLILCLEQHQKELSPLDQKRRLDEIELLIMNSEDDKEVLHRIRRGIGNWFFGNTLKIQKELLKPIEKRVEVMQAFQAIAYQYFSLEPFKPENHPAILTLLNVIKSVGNSEDIQHIEIIKIKKGVQLFFERQDLLQSLKEDLMEIDETCEKNYFHEFMTLFFTEEKYRKLRPIFDGLELWRIAVSKVKPMTFPIDSLGNLDSYLSLSDSNRGLEKTMISQVGVWLYHLNLADICKQLSPYSAHSIFKLSATINYCVITKKWEISASLRQRLDALHTQYPIIVSEIKRRIDAG